MTFRASGLALIPYACPDATQDVLFEGNDPQMDGVNAPTIAAYVVDNHVIEDSLAQKLEHHSMRLTNLAAHIYSPVTAYTPVSRPTPARGFSVVPNLLKKSVEQRTVHSPRTQCAKTLAAYTTITP